ncbi:MAG: 16S rRNA (uracil(1498)-N(3))-methyltransferase [Chromatiales bacterium]|nr:16S rRNA (uracil(1498)-N(3))-methyltransferase [Chromatiales bacterium]
MRQVRVFLDRPLRAGEEFELNGPALHHVATVLRMRAGEQLTIFNGQGGEFYATLMEVQRRRCILALGDYLTPQRESNLQTTLLQGIAKGERMDFALQKATELGVSRVIAVACARSQAAGERGEKRLRHWQGVVVSACEQSGRLRIPQVEIQDSLQSALATCDQDRRLVMVPGGESLATGGQPPSSLALLVGPEGGLDDTEIAMAIAEGFQPWGLGPRVLRTETAAVAALALVQSQWGDLAMANSV